MKPLRTVAVLPTLFTLGNLVCGFFAIVIAARIDRPTEPEPPMTHRIQVQQNSLLPQLRPDDETHNCMLSGWLIFLAMVFDALDGHVARLARTSSDFGAQLDSLCDAVTFGVAPSFLLVKMCHTFTYHHSQVVWVIAAAYACCAVLRLARFNMESSEDDDHFSFSGLPSPAAAAAIAGFAMLFYELRREGSELSDLDELIQRLLPGLAVIVALLMVSRIPYPHIVNQMFRGQRSLGHVVMLLFAIGGIMAFHAYAVPVVGCAFVLIPPIRYFVLRLTQRHDEQEPIF
jgi:CDP-diacylglycerol---serine O-phosphatidyltransferase